MAVGRPRDRVAVLIGGGSGHYPTRCGLVGPGLADIAVVGNTFASPSAQQILGCTRAVDAGHGVIYLYGNYAGDRLNFDAAAEAAASEGILIRQVVGCDDVASAPVGRETERRGVAGDFFLFKIAGAAASDGRDLEGVARWPSERTHWSVPSVWPSTAVRCRDTASRCSPWLRARWR
jgi:dihydroxyacetone kinase